jgi:hypothetical protein
VAKPSPEDRFALEDLMIRYTTAMDEGDVEGVVGCFVEDCLLESNIIGTHPGREGVRMLAAQMALLREEGRQYRHAISNFRIDVEGNRGRVRCYLLDYLTMEGKVELVSPGQYACDVVIVRGNWFIKVRRVTTDVQFSLPGLPKAG